MWVIENAAILGGDRVEVIRKTWSGMDEKHSSARTKFRGIGE